MDVRSLFTIHLLILGCFAIGAYSKQNETVSKVPTKQAISEDHNLAEPAKLNLPSMNNTTLTTPSAVKATPSVSSAAANVTQAEPKENPAAPAKHAERKVMGREGVVVEHQPKNNSKEAVNSTSVATAPTLLPKKGPDAAKNVSVSVNSSSGNHTGASTNATSSSTQPAKSPISTTSSTTTTTTTTTTPKPKKPTVTYSIEDAPAIINATRGKIHDRNQSGGRLSVEMPDPPVAQPSSSMGAAVPPIHRDYFISVVAIIFAVPIIMGAGIVMVRRFKDYWSTRHYRRMDFLVDGMYND